MSRVRRYGEGFGEELSERLMGSLNFIGHVSRTGLVNAGNVVKGAGYAVVSPVEGLVRGLSGDNTPLPFGKITHNYFHEDTAYGRNFYHGRFFGEDDYGRDTTEGYTGRIVGRCLNLSATPIATATWLPARMARGFSTGIPNFLIGIADGVSKYSRHRH